MEKKISIPFRDLEEIFGSISLSGQTFLEQEMAFCKEILKSQGKTLDSQRVLGLSENECFLLQFAGHPGKSQDPTALGMEGVHINVVALDAEVEKAGVMEMRFPDVLSTRMFPKLLIYRKLTYRCLLATFPLTRANNKFWNASYKVLEKQQEEAHIRLPEWFLAPVPDGLKERSLSPFVDNPIDHELVKYGDLAASLASLSN